DPEAEGEAFRRFEERFRRLVRLRPDQLAEGRKQDVVRDLLTLAWERVKKSYQLPSSPAGFSWYVRNIIRVVGLPPCSSVQNRFSETFEDLALYSDPLNTAKAAGIEEDIRQHEFGNKLRSGWGSVAPSPREAAALVGVKERTFYALVRKGVIPAERKGAEIIL